MNLIVCVNYFHYFYLNVSKIFCKSTKKVICRNLKFWFMLMQLWKAVITLIFNKNVFLLKWYEFANNREHLKSEDKLISRYQFYSAEDRLLYCFLLFVQSICFFLINLLSDLVNKDSFGVISDR